MDRSWKRSAGRLMTRTKACISGSKDATSEGDENAQFCNRIGCRGRIKYTHNTKSGSSDKAEGSSSSRSSDENKLIGKSSLYSSMITSARKSFIDSKRNLPLGLDLDSLGLSESEALAIMSSPSGCQSKSVKRSGEVTVRETRKLRISANTPMSSPSSRTEDELEPTKKSGGVTVRESRRTRLNAHTSSPSSQTGDQSESMKKSGEVTVRGTRSTRIIMPSPESTKNSAEITSREARRPRISLNAFFCSPNSQTSDKSESTKKFGDNTVIAAGQLRISQSSRMSTPSSRTGDHSGSKKMSRDVAVTETLRPKVSLNVRPIISHDMSKLHHQNNPPSSSTPLASKSSTIVGASDVVPPSSGGERSSFRAKKMAAGSTIDRKNSPSTRGNRVSDSRLSSGTDSVSTRSLANSRGRVGLSSQQNGRSGSSASRLSVRISQSANNVDQNSRRQLSVGVSSSGSRISSPSNSIGDSEHDTEGIVEEVLSQSFEHNVEWAQEEARALHLSNLDDQHRDMRLDIDNMSYEELLALEDRMGTVSTALSEEALSKCLRRSIYQPDPLEVQNSGTGEDGEDIKCSICQEEFVAGDEVGELVDCQHGYHVTCINEWLKLKNWCPICKTSAGPSQSSLSSL